MTTQDNSIEKAFSEVNPEILAKKELDGFKEGFAKGFSKGFIGEFRKVHDENLRKCREKTKLEIAQNLKERLDDTEIARITDLPLDKIQNI